MADLNNVYAKFKAFDEEYDTLFEKLKALTDTFDGENVAVHRMNLERAVFILGKLYTMEQHESLTLNDLMYVSGVSAVVKKAFKDRLSLVSDRVKVLEKLNATYKDMAWSLYQIGMR